MLEAQRFRIKAAVMVVHSFSQPNASLEDYQDFLGQYGLKAGTDEAVSTKLDSGIDLHFAWVHGDEKYLAK